MRPEIRIDWLAASPAKEYLLERGERILPEAGHLANATPAAEDSAAAGRLNLNKFAFGFRKQWAESGRICMSLMQTGAYDLFLGDETYDVAMHLARRSSPPGFPVFILFDFLGLDVTTRSPIDWLIVLGFNRVWSTEPKRRYQPVFLGELEDIPLRPFLPFGPARRAWAKRHVLIVDHVLDFDPRAYSSPADRAAVRTRLGYGPEPTVLVSVGGTAVGACKVKGVDGYQYHPLWMNPLDAEARGIKKGDVVATFNERGTVLAGAYVTERIIPGTVGIDHGAKYDPIVPGVIDRGGVINTIVPGNPTSQNTVGMAVSGFLAEVEKADLEALRTECPEAFARECHPAAGPCLAGVLMEGAE